MSDATTGIAKVTDRKRTLSDDHQESTGLTFNNDDSGFSEPQQLTNNTLDNTKTASRNSPSELDIWDHILDFSNKLQENNLPPDGTPVPRSSSTPNRLEIFIDENWIKDREDIENELYDVNLNDSVTDLYWSETKDENNNVCEGKGKELRRSQGLLNQNPETGLNESTGESVIPVALKKESGNSAAFQNEFSYFISNRNEQTLASCKLNKDKLSDVKEATSNIDLVDTRTLVKNGDQLIKPDFRPLVQIKTELYDDVSDDDAPNLDVFKVKAEPVEEIHNPLASDKRREFKAIDENAKLTHETNISSNDAKISNTCKETPETVNKDTAIPKRKRVGRKTKTPKRSPKKCDPNFMGATVWFQTEYRRGRSRLNISAFYSNVAMLFTDKTRQGLFGNHLISCSPDSSRYSDTEENSTPPYGRETFITAKTCASCRTRRTPLWRDAEDGTPLCNACGIRYKKYRLRCSRCWHIPKKDIKTYPNCPACGASLRYVFSRRTW